MFPADDVFVVIADDLDGRYSKHHDGGLQMERWIQSR